MAPASATPPTQPGPTLILRAHQIDLGPLSRSSGAHLLPQHHSPHSLSPSYSPFSRSPTSLVLGPTPIQTQTNPSVSSSPLLLSPLPQLFPRTYLLPCGPAHQDPVPPPSPFPLGRPKSLVDTPLPAAPLAQPRPRPALQWPRPLVPPPAAPPPAASTFDVFPWEPAGVGDRMPARLRVGGGSWRRRGQRGDREPAAHGARGGGIAQVAAARLLKRQELPRPPRVAPGPSARCAQPPQSGHSRPWALSFTRSTRGAHPNVSHFARRVPPSLLESPEHLGFVQSAQVGGEPVLSGGDLCTYSLLCLPEAYVLRRT